MVRFGKETFVKLSPGLLLTLTVGLVCEYFNPMQNRFLRFGVNGVVLVTFFLLFMWFFSFNDYEKSLLTGTVKKVLQKIKCG